MPRTVDLDDHYFYFDERIDFLRAEDRFVVSLDAGANVEDVSAALTEASGPLAGYELTTQLSEGELVFSRPDDLTFTEIDLDDVESATGVDWAAPVFVGEGTSTVTIFTDEVIVALEQGVDPAEFFAEGFVSWAPFVGNQYIASIEEGGVAALDVANDLAANEDTEWAQPNMYAGFEQQTNDPLFETQWTLNNTGQFDAKVDADVDVEQAWNTTTGSSNVVIAVLDSGVQLNHPDLNIFVNPGEIAGNGVDDDGNGFIDDVNGWDFVDVDNNTNPGTSAQDAHGTAVAGVAAASGDNSVGVTGASQNSAILPVRISGSGGFATSSVLARAVYYAAGAVLNPSGQIVGTWRGADVINASWGGGSQDASLTAAFNYASNDAKGGQGIPVLVASGNSAAGRQGSGTEQYNGKLAPAADLFETFGNSSWSWVLSYKKDASGTAGEDAVRLGRFVNDDGTNTRWDTTTAPAGWELAPFLGEDGWVIEDNPSRAHGTGRYEAKSSSIGNSDQAFIMAPAIAVNAANPGMSAAFYTFQSSAVADTMILSLFNHTNGQLYDIRDNMNVNLGEYAGVVPVLDQNRDVDVAYPANIPSVIAVGASTDWDYRSHYAQYGTALDIVAPSNGGYVGVNTTDPTGNNGATGGDYASFGGTSAAAPLAAGIAALLLSQNPNLTAAEIRTILENTADKVGGDNGATAYNAAGFNPFYGHGRVNAAAAVDVALTAGGDFNRDSAVDGLDFLSWQRGFGNTAAPVGSGADGDLSGSIGAGDLAVWQDHYGQTVPSAAVTSVSSTATVGDSPDPMLYALASRASLVQHESERALPVADESTEIADQVFAGYGSQASPLETLAERPTFSKGEPGHSDPAKSTLATDYALKEFEDSPLGALA